MGLNKDTWTKTKRLVFARDGELCLRCLGEAQDCHHRVVRGMGGSSDPERNYGLSGLVSLCRPCHGHVHANPGESYDLGYLVHSWDSPAGIPLVVKPGSVLVWLTADGRTEKYEQATLF